MAENGSRAALGPALVDVVAHLALGSRYGWHRDELYFVVCGRNLAFGYVDHPPLVPLLARLQEELLGTSAAALRVLPALAGCATILLAARVVRELGGGRFARLFAGLAVLLAPAFARMGATLNIPVFEPLFWTGGALLVLRILRGASPRWWLGVGAIAGLGLLNKHTMLLWGAGLVAGLLSTEHRRQLRSPWLWAGGALALLIAAPNIVWQAQHDWATVQFARNMAGGVLAREPRVLFVLGQLLYTGPLSAPLWIAGGVALWRRGAAERVLVVQVLAIAAVLLITRAKPYYLSAAFPVLLAAGAVRAEQWFRSSRARTVAASAFVAGSMPMTLLSMPVFSLQATDRALGALFGWLVPPTALTHDMHDEYGWPELARATERVAAELPEPQRRSLAIHANNYGEASAINVLASGLPRATSGHMSYHVWGPEPGSTLLLIRPSDEVVARLCENPEVRARVDHELAHPAERDAPIVVCAARVPLSEAWPELRRWYHGSQRPVL